MIANIQPISIRTNQLILRHWYRAKFSSAHHPLNEAITKFQPNQKTISQTPFDRATKILNNNQTGITINNLINPINNPITSLPKYNLFEIPNNYNITMKPTCKSEINHSDTNIYTDGSCSPNQGKGHGWYSPNYNKMPI